MSFSCHQELNDQLGHRNFDSYIKARFITAQIFMGMTSTSGTSYHCANFNNLFFQVLTSIFSILLLIHHSFAARRNGHLLPPNTTLSCIQCLMPKLWMWLHSSPLWFLKMLTTWRNIFHSTRSLTSYDSQLIQPLVCSKDGCNP